MLTGADEPTIRWAILKRLGQEAGLTIFDIKVRPTPGVIKVGVSAMLGKTIPVNSRFDLPDPFEHGHLIDEIDEIAEQYKVIRGRFFAGTTKGAVDGTGLRGRWARYGLRL